MALTSPPYDNVRDYEGYSFDFDALVDELFRVTKDGGVVVWNVAEKNTQLEAIRSVMENDSE